MKKFTQLLSVSVACVSISNAQSLYNIGSSYNEAAETSPWKFSLGASIGTDDNPTPFSNNAGDDTAFQGNVYATAATTTVTPQQTIDFYARAGYRYYFSDLAPGGQKGSPQVSAGLNYTKRFSERLRFSSRNKVSYEFEPDYEQGGAAGRRVGEYLQYSTANSVGYQWFERLGTETGVSYRGIQYQDVDDSDYNALSFNHSFRYRATPATVYTLGYSYSVTDLENRDDSRSHFYSVGVEHRFSPTSAITVKTGFQNTERDGGVSFTNPFVEASLKSQLTEQFNAAAFARYSHEAQLRVLQVGQRTPAIYDESSTLRFGVRGRYALNPRVGIFGSVNYTSTDYEKSVGATYFRDSSDGAINLNIGADYQVNDSLSVSASYSHTNAFSDFSVREYTRNRVQLGIQTSF